MSTGKVDEGRRVALRTAAYLAIVASTAFTTYRALRLLDAWVGDWAAVAWELCTFSAPFFLGLGVGKRLPGWLGVLLGGGGGVLVATGPIAVYITLSGALTWPAAASALLGTPSEVPASLLLPFAGSGFVMGACGLSMGAQIRGGRFVAAN